jgi:hypothetical protein
LGRHRVSGVILGLGVRSARRLHRRRARTIALMTRLPANPPVYTDARGRAAMRVGYRARAGNRAR